MNKEINKYNVNEQAAFIYGYLYATALQMKDDEHFNEWTIKDIIKEILKGVVAK